MSKTNEFLSDESGAVTVDWTVLAAAVVGLGVASVGAVRSGVVSLGTDINTSLSGASIAALGELGSNGLLAFTYTPRVLSQEDLEYWINYVQNEYLPIYGVEDVLFHYQSLALDPLATVDPSDPYFNDRLDWGYVYYEALTRAGVDIPPEYAHFPEIVAANP